MNKLLYLPDVVHISIVQLPSEESFAQWQQKLIFFHTLCVADYLHCITTIYFCHLSKKDHNLLNTEQEFTEMLQLMDSIGEATLNKPK